MINLLPAHERKEIRREYVLRRAVVSLTFSFGVILAGVVLLAPMYFEYRGANRRIQEELAALSARVESGGVSVEKAVRDLNIKLSITAPATSTIPLASHVVSQVRHAIIPGVSLTTLAFDRLPQSPEASLRKATIGGIAQDRETLLRFARVLDLEPNIGNVDSPISNLTKRNDLSFIVTFDIVNP